MSLFEQCQAFLLGGATGPAAGAMSTCLCLQVYRFFIFENMTNLYGNIFQWVDIQINCEIWNICSLAWITKDFIKGKRNKNNREFCFFISSWCICNHRSCVEELMEDGGLPFRWQTISIVTTKTTNLNNGDMTFMLFKKIYSRNPMLLPLPRCPVCRSWVLGTRRVFMAWEQRESEKCDEGGKKSNARCPRFIWQREHCVTFRNALLAALEITRDTLVVKVWEWL